VRKVIIGHHYWGRPGGGQLVCAATAYSLENIGYTPVLTSTMDFNPENYKQWFGIDLTKYERVTWNIKLNMFGIMLRLFAWKPMLNALKKHEANLLFTDESTYKPLLKYKGKEDFKIIEYIHFPYEITVFKKYIGTGLYYKEDPYITERYGKFPMNIYWWIFTKVLPKYLRKNPFESADLIITNSDWTANIIKTVFGEKPKVLNPPLPPNLEIVENARPFEKRKKSIVMVGRFSEEKRYHWVIEKVMPKLLKEIPEAKLYIFGGAGTGTALRYVERLKKLIKKNNIENSVILLLGASRSIINDVMDRSRVFLHATINEHWGIAVAEALARKLPIVVHKSGGAWSDIAKEGEYGLGYENEEEAVAHLSRLLTDEKSWIKYSTYDSERIKKFTLNTYKNNLASLIKAL
jgi:glycosyltransferase involved in cell wall biosynthesis